MKLVPAPSTFAPIALRQSARSTISGSRAAPAMTLVPLASDAAIIRFSVAPTDGWPSRISAPFSPLGAVACT